MVKEYIAIFRCWGTPSKYNNSMWNSGKGNMYIHRSVIERLQTCSEDNTNCNFNHTHELDLGEEFNKCFKFNHIRGQFDVSKDLEQCNLAIEPEAD